jgi:glycosyltransferase involved in cell wall biosynthesis
MILVQNRETLAWLPERHHPKAAVFPNAALELPAGPPPPQRVPPSRTVMFAGRLLPWKGVALAIRTMELLPDWRLVVIGSGGDEARLRRMVHTRGLTERVEFLSAVPREELLRRMREDTGVFLFPSLHDDGPWVVAEATSCGLPVVCLDVGGPPLLGGRAVPPSTPAGTAAALAEAVNEAFARPRHPLPDFTLASRAHALSQLLAAAGLLRQPSAPKVPR